MIAANTVSRASAAFASPHGEHHRDDQRDLDHRDRDREHQRAVRFADPVRDDLGVMDGREHGAAEARRDDDEEAPAGQPDRDGQRARPTPRSA